MIFVSFGKVFPHFFSGITASKILRFTQLLTFNYANWYITTKGQNDNGCKRCGISSQNALFLACRQKAQMANELTAEVASEKRNQLNFHLF